MTLQKDILAHLGGTEMSCFFKGRRRGKKCRKLGCWKAGQGEKKGKGRRMEREEEGKWKRKREKVNN